MLRIYTIIALTNICLASMAQSIEEKFYPADPSRASAYGSEIAAEGNTLVVSDAWASDANCTGAQGAVYIYKKYPNRDWELTQTLTTSAAHSNFGSQVALNGNMLLVTSRNEIRPDGDSTGAMYLYKRDNIYSNFRFSAKAFADSEWVNNGTSNISFFMDVALNSKFAVGAVGNTNHFWVFEIGNDTLIRRKGDPGFSYQGPPAKIGITDNNIVVGMNEQFLNYYKIEQDTIIETRNGFISGYTYYSLLAVDGNTVATEFTSTFKGNIISQDVRRVGKDGKDSAIVNLTKKTPFDLYSIAMQEDEWIFGLDEKEPYIMAFKYDEGSYKFAGSIARPAGFTSAFSNSISVDGNLLAIADVQDSTQENRSTGTCSPKAGRGAVTGFYTNGFHVITGIEDDHAGQNAIGPLLSPNPFNGETLTITQPRAERVEIMDASGAAVQTAAVTNGTCKLTGLQQGMYLVKVYSSSGIKTAKLAVE